MRRRKRRQAKSGLSGVGDVEKSGIGRGKTGREKKRMMKEKRRRNAEYLQ